MKASSTISSPYFLKRGWIGFIAAGLVQVAHLSATKRPVFI